MSTNHKNFAAGAFSLSIKIKERFDDICSATTDMYLMINLMLQRYTG